MDVKTAKEKKIELETNIGHALQNFAADTETTIESIELTLMEDQIHVEIVARLSTGGAT
jgi:fructose-1,6-bisphosphatase/sedoheptulose 1,7-bisphosphatase-like protein